MLHKSYWRFLRPKELSSYSVFQERAFKGRSCATCFEVQPDFALIAQACKCYGEKVEDPLQIKPAIGRALDANNRGIPAVLDCIIGGKEIELSSEFAEFFGLS